MYNGTMGRRFSPNRSRSRSYDNELGRKRREDDLIIALDPSGNFTEGKGTTGWCVSNGDFIFAAGQVYAAEYRSQMEYWEAVLDIIRKNIQRESKSLTVVCEDYRLYASASEAQINSNLETPQLIGVIKFFCHTYGIPIVMQMASEVKNRWSNEVLLELGKIQKDGRAYRIGSIPLSNHSLDAVRHCLHYAQFKMRPQKPRAYHSNTRRFSYYD